MDVSRRRVGVRCSVVAGSVWESRMKSDEVEGGVKVFSGEQSAEEGGNGATRLKRRQIRGVVATAKRKTWMSERSEGLENNQIQIARGKPEFKKNYSSSSSSQQRKDLNISSDSSKKSPIQARKLKAEGSNEIGASVSADKLEPSPIHTRRKRYEVAESGERNVADGNGGNAMQIRKDKSQLDESRNVMDGLAGESGRIVIHNGKNDSDENCMAFGVCQEKVNSSNSDNAGMVKYSPVNADEDSDDDGEEEDEEIDIEKEKGSFDVKEISVPESKVVNEQERKEVVNVPKEQKIVSEPQPTKVVSINRQFHQRNQRPVSVSITMKPSPPITKHSTIHQNFSKADIFPIPKAEEYYSFPESQNNLQSLVDLIMWRDISRSAFIFGIGTFTIVSSSYAKDINLRGVIDVDTNYVLGEEEAIWVLKLILPYLNEFLSKLRAMFSGDPGTTIKLAVFLFVLARCGSSITIWKMAKYSKFLMPRLFRMPMQNFLLFAPLLHVKIESFLSPQIFPFSLAFWVTKLVLSLPQASLDKLLDSSIPRCLGFLLLQKGSDSWNLWPCLELVISRCSHLVRYYQQHYLVRDEWVENEAGCDETWQEPVDVVVGIQKQRPPSNFFETHKVKKGF
ncbi:Reticulon-like protein B21, partial [Mucuna pruriens]